MSEEWGPWIEHDGKGCPCVGMLVESVVRSGNVAVHIAEGQAVFLDGTPTKIDKYTFGSAWVWDAVHLPSDVIRYRIRKPRALLEMIERARELDAPEGPARVKPKVGA